MSKTNVFKFPTKARQTPPAAETLMAVQPNDDEFYSLGIMELLNAIAFYDSVEKDEAARQHLVLQLESTPLSERGRVIVDSVGLALIQSVDYAQMYKLFLDLKAEEERQC